MEDQSEFASSLLSASAAALVHATPSSLSPMPLRFKSPFEYASTMHRFVVEEAVAGVQDAQANKDWGLVAWPGVVTSCVAPLAPDH
jgi:hypothetical protein